MNLRNPPTTLVWFSLCFIALACGPVPGPAGPAGSRRVDPDACGNIRAKDAGRKIHAFLKATAVLDREVLAAESTAKKACVTMATELGLSTAGDTRTVCKTVADGIRDHTATGLKANSVFNVVYKPVSCTVDMDVASKLSAECEAKAQAEMNVSCSGTCTGSCHGECSGQCSQKAANGQCAGTCSEDCTGRCEGSCTGSAEVDASAECKAAAEIHANVDAKCTPPEIDIQIDAALVIDAAKIDRLKKALAAGLPTLIMLRAKLEGPVARAVSSWSTSARGLHQASGQLVSALGSASVCVADQIGLALQALTRIQGSVSVTVEVSVEVSGSAHAHP